MPLAVPREGLHKGEGIIAFRHPSTPDPRMAKQGTLRSWPGPQRGRTPAGPLPGRNGPSHPLAGAAGPDRAAPSQGVPGPLGLEKMLRIYFVQQWFNLSDPQTEHALRQRVDPPFCRGELGDDVVPDETTILRFRHLLERHQLTKALFGAIRELLTEKRLPLQAGRSRKPRSSMRRVRPRMSRRPATLPCTRPARGSCSTSA
jgi:hypothetical protein